MLFDGTFTSVTSEIASCWCNANKQVTQNSVNMISEPCLFVHVR